VQVQKKSKLYYAVLTNDLCVTRSAKKSRYYMSSMTNKCSAKLSVLEASRCRRVS